MLTDDEIKAAEKRGYAKGYVAGKKRLQKQRDVERIQRERDAFRRRAFLAALPACVAAKSWVTGDKKPINTLTERITLAWRFADEAMKGYW